MEDLHTLFRRPQRFGARGTNIMEWRQVAYLLRKEIQPPAYGELLMISVKAIGDPPSIRGPNMPNQAQAKCAVQNPDCALSYIDIYVHFHGRK